jgi:hypothetical protein
LKCLKLYVKLKKQARAVIVVPEVIYHVGQREDLLPFVEVLARGGLAEPEEKVLERRARRRNDPDLPSYVLPPPTWGGTVSAAVTGWVPALVSADVAVCRRVPAAS